MGNNAGTIVLKVVSSIILAVVGFLLSAIIGEFLETQLLGFLFISTLVFPVWYPSSIQSRSFAAVIGPMVGLGVWYCSRLVLMFGQDPALILLSGLFYPASIIVGLGVEAWIMRPHKPTPQSNAEISPSAVPKEPFVTFSWGDKRLWPK